MKAAITLLLLASTALFAQDSSTETKVNRVAMWASISARTADTAQTCYAFAHGMHEQTTPIVHNCAGIAAWNGGMTLAAIGSQKLMHRLGWHKLESLPNWLSFGGSAIALQHSLTHEHFR